MASSPEPTVGRGPAKPPVNKHEQVLRWKSELRKAIWELSQYCTYTEIYEHVEIVIGEIASDEP
jgi:hypothetical protein